MFNYYLSFTNLVEKNGKPRKKRRKTNHKYGKNGLHKCLWGLDPHRYNKQPGTQKHTSEKELERNIFYEG